MKLSCAKVFCSRCGERSLRVTRAELGSEAREPRAERERLDATSRLADEIPAGDPRIRDAIKGLVANLAPEWPWPDEKREPLKTRYLAGL